MRGREQRLKRGLRASECPAPLHRGDAAEVRLAVIDVVAQPEHDVRFHRRDRSEDLGIGTVGHSRTIHLRLVGVVAGAERHGEVRRVAPPLPERLRVEIAGRASGRKRGGSASDQDLVPVPRSRIEARDHEQRGVIGLLAGEKSRRRATLGAFPLRPVTQPYLGVRCGLDPHRRLGQIRVAEHRSRSDGGFRGARRGGGRREEDGGEEQGREDDFPHGSES